MATTKNFSISKLEGKTSTELTELGAELASKKDGFMIEYKQNSKKIQDAIVIAVAKEVAERNLDPKHKAKSQQVG